MLNKLIAIVVTFLTAPEFVMITDDPVNTFFIWWYGAHSGFVEYAQSLYILLVFGGMYIVTLYLIEDFTDKERST